MPTDEEIQANIQDREWFEEMEKERGPRFWELCRGKLTKERKRKEKENPEMTPEQAASFGRHSMHYGMHEGTAIEDIPTEYLTFIANELPWLKKLNLYLRHRHD